MKTFSIGLLLPTSSILPMGKDFEKGLKRGLGDLMQSGEVEIEIIPEIIGQGSRKMVETGVDRLFNYHNVDIAAGIVSNKVISHVAPQFDRLKKYFVASNLGEHLPEESSPYILLNSTHTWQQVWSLAHWGVKEFGNTGMFVSGIYESGYVFMQMMNLGMATANPESVIPYAVAPFDASGRTADILSVFEHIEQFKPNFVFSCFCGSEATVFLEEYIRRGYHKTIPLLSLPFIAESFDAKGEQVEIYSAMSSYKTLTGGNMNGNAATHQNPFPGLGYETGLLIAEMLKQSFVNLHEGIAVHSDRGEVTIGATLPPGENHKIYLVKSTHKGEKNTIEKEIIKELPTVSYEDQSIRNSLEMINSGWDNPYLGV